MLRRRRGKHVSRCEEEESHFSASWSARQRDGHVAHARPSAESLPGPQSSRPQPPGLPRPESSFVGRQQCPRGLIHEGDNGIRIWLKRWSEIIGECKHRLRFIRDQLQYDPGADQAIAYLRDRYPDYLPADLIHHAASRDMADQTDELGSGNATTSHAALSADARE